MIASTNWDKPFLNQTSGGELIGRWLEEAKNTNNNLLFICGAGISMTGTFPGPTGWHVGDAYENYLRGNRGEVVPPEISGDLAKLYEHFCYPINESQKKVFSQEAHNEFIEAITDSSNSFRFSGKPNFQHMSLVNEVIESKGKVRVYSLNMDEFFEFANTFVYESSKDLVVNAAELMHCERDNSSFREWGILAAHGKNLKNQQSVWSHTLLSNPIDQDIDEHLINEKKILEASLECLQQAPYFKRVVFVGLAAPLTYLIEKLKVKLSPNFEWIWINPFANPQSWLLDDPGKKFNEDNGEWIKAGLTECLWTAHSNFYKKWFSVTCKENADNIPLLRRYFTPQHDIALVEKVYRARRIYDLGFEIFQKVDSNLEMLHSIDADKSVYSYPEKTSGNQYSDQILGYALHKLFEKGIKFTNSGAFEHPKLTIAVKTSEEYPFSVHILKVNRAVPENIIANGISKTFESIILNPDHRHIIVIDSNEDVMPGLTRAIEEEIATRFPKDYNLIDVVFSNHLEEFITRIETNSKPIRTRRP